MFNFSSREHQASPPFQPDVFFAEYAMSYRQDMPKDVLSFFNAYVEEVLEICKAHGVKHPKELGTAQLTPTIETLQRVCVLMDKIKYLLEHKELPIESVDEKEYTLPVPSDLIYVRVQDLQGKFAAVFEDQDHAKIVDQNGQLIESFPETNMEIDKLQNINGRLGYRLALHPLENDRTLFFRYHGRVLGSPKGYSQGQILNIGGKPILFAEMPGENSKLLRADGSIMGKEDGYGAIIKNTFFDVAGKLFFLWKDAHQTVHLCLEGNEVGDPRGYVLFDILSDTTWKKPVVAVSPSDLACVVKDQKNGRWHPFRFNGETFGDPEGYDTVTNNGSFFELQSWTVHKGHQTFYVGMDGNVHEDLEKVPKKTPEEKCAQVWEDLDEEGWTMIVEGKRFFVPEDFIHICSTQDTSIFLMQNKPVYAASYEQEGDVFYSIWHGHKRITEPFGRIFALQKLDDHRFYVLALEKNGKKKTIVKRVIDLDML